jgi:hypothetical protein
LQVHQLLPPSNQATALAHQFAYTILSSKIKAAQQAAARHATLLINPRK